MKSHYRALAGALAFVCAASTSAQVPTTTPASQASVSATATPPPAATQAVLLSDPAPNVLRAGTPIFLKMSEGLTTEKKKLRTGQRFQLEVAEPVLVNGKVVVPAGSPATGEVTQVRNKACGASPAISAHRRSSFAPTANKFA